MPERKLTVFLVDDESIIRNGMKKLFDWESNGFTITGEAENGRDALPLILSLKPDIIITDLKMPFCDVRNKKSPAVGRDGYSHRL